MTDTTTTNGYEDGEFERIAATITGTAESGVPLDDFDAAAVAGALAHARVVREQIAGSPALQEIFAKAKEDDAGVEDTSLAKAVADKLNRAAEASNRPEIRDLRITLEHRRQEALDAAKTQRFRNPDADAVPAVLDVDGMFAYYKEAAGRKMVREIVPVRGTGSFFGPSGSGKSTNIGALSLHLAHGPGAKWFGYDVLEKVATLHVVFEDVFEAHVKLSAQAAALGYGRAELELQRWIPDPGLSVASETEIAEFVEKVGAIRDELAEKGHRLGLIYHDTQRHMHPGSSVVEESVTSLVTSLLRTLERRYGLLACVVQHTPQADDQRVAGNGEQRGDKTVQFRFVNGRAAIEKGRGIRGRELGRYRIEEHPPVDPDGRLITELVAEGTSCGVVYELTPAENLAAASEELHDGQDGVMRRELLAALRLPPKSTGRGDPPEGWSDAKAGNAMRDVAKREHRPSCVMALPDTPRPFSTTRKALDYLNAMAKEGLVLNLARGRTTGNAAAWLSTKDGLDWLDAAGGAVCTCPK